MLVPWDVVGWLLNATTTTDIVADTYECHRKVTSSKLLHSTTEGKAGQRALEEVVRKVLQRNPMNNATADLASQLMAIRPEDNKEEASELLGLAVEAVKYGVPMLNRFGGDAAALAAMTDKDKQNYKSFLAAQKEYEKAWQTAGEEPGLVALWGDMLGVTELISKSQAQADELQLRESRDEFEQKLQELVDMYKSLQWTARLPIPPTWEDVVREIEYFFWRGQGGGGDASAGDSAGKVAPFRGVIEKLESLYASVEKLWENHQKQCTVRKRQPPEDLANKWAEISISCRVLNTEEYCVRQYVDHGDASSNKLSKRQSHASSF